MKKKTQAQVNKPKVRFGDLWWYRPNFPIQTPLSKAQHHRHKSVCCKNTSRNWQNFFDDQKLSKLRSDAGWLLEIFFERTILHYICGTRTVHCSRPPRHCVQRHDSVAADFVPTKFFEPTKLMQFHVVRVGRGLKNSPRFEENRRVCGFQPERQC